MFLIYSEGLIAKGVLLFLNIVREDSEHEN